MDETHAVEGGREVGEGHLNVFHLVSEAAEIVAVCHDERPEGDGDDAGDGEGSVADVGGGDAAHRLCDEEGDVRDYRQQQGNEEEGDEQELHGCTDFLNDNKDITDFLNDNTDNNDNGKNGRNCGCHEVTYNKDNGITSLLLLLLLSLLSAKT